MSAAALPRGGLVGMLLVSLGLTAGVVALEARTETLHLTVLAVGALPEAPAEGEDPVRAVGLVVEDAPAGAGAVVREVVGGRSAAAAGVEAGDVVVRAAAEARTRVKVRSAADLRGALRAGLPPGVVHLRVERALPPQARGRLVAAAAPVLAALLACFHPGVLAALRTWRPRRVAWLGVGLALWAVVVPAARFDPYAVAIVGAGACAAVLAPRERLTPGRLGALGLGVWLLLWIPFDLRWYRDLWLAPAMGYEVLALLVSALAVLAFGVAGRLDDLGLRPPRWSDVGWALAPGVILGVVVVPLGLGLGFLELGEGAAFGWGQAGLVGLGLLLTVALPEELFFRGVLDAGLREHLRRPWLSLLVSSSLFGLMHWNNRGDLGEQVAYVFLATIAGAIYGLAFRRTGGLAAPVLMHTLVDLVWAAFLGG